MKTERIGAAFVVLLGAGYLWKAFRLENIDIGDPLGPRAFPILLGIIMTILGCSLLVKPDAATSEEAPFGKASFTVAALAILLTLYSLAIGTIGYPLSTFLFLLLSSRILGEKIRPRGLALAVFISLGIFFLFTRVLDIPLPLWGALGR